MEMRRFTTYVIAVLVAGSAALVAQKAQTPEDLDKAMKKLMPANAAMNKAIKSMAWADARKQLDVVEEALEDAHNFWVVKKRDDAVKMSTDARTKADVLEDLLEKSSPDSVAITAAAKEFASSCLGCHKQFREQDANQQFILKPGI
jgi:cytochrome c556